MTTSDGISTEDWDTVHELTVDLVNAGERPDEEECRHRLFEYLDELEEKYGARPSILATRADFIVGDVPRKLELLGRAYALAGAAGDARNQLHIASSLAELHIEEHGDTNAGSMWLSRAKDSLDQIGNDVDRREYDRARDALERLRLRKDHV